jgi:hypothetical protein
VATGTPYEQEERHRQADGTYRWFLARGIPLRDSEGRIIRWYGTNPDIQNRKQVEEGLRRLSGQLLHSQDEERRRIAGIYTILSVKTSSLWPPRWVNCMSPFLLASEAHANFFLSARN